MIGSYNSTEARANFLLVPGRSIAYTYDTNGNVTKETYKEGGVVIFAVNYTYDSDGNMTEASCTND